MIFTQQQLTQLKDYDSSVITLTN